MDNQGIKTLTNLTLAFIGESQARNRYTFYASKARKEGYEQIGAIFEETATQEKEHAKKLFEEIQKLKGKVECGRVDVEANYILGTTLENLKAAVAGENHEWGSMYPSFADVAEKEGFAEVSKRLRSIAIAEKHHEERYKKLIEQMEKQTVFKKEEIVEWTCRECGYVHKGKQPPEKCPVCEHATAFYQIKSENY